VERGRELTEEWRRGEVLIDLPPDVRECLERHIDNWIKLWRFREAAGVAGAAYRIEAFQTVRKGVLGAPLL